MKFNTLKWIPPLATLVFLFCATNAPAQLHDPMRPGRGVTQGSAAGVEKGSAALPPLTAILIGSSSRSAVFGNRQVHEGEYIGRYRLTRIHPGKVELFDGKTRLERRLFPAISTFEDHR
ncbi:MAG: hypothetical protein ACOC0G_00295 [Thermodesulfobacteriota bacterium]